MSKAIICFSTDNGSGAQTKIQQVDDNHGLPISGSISAVSSAVATAAAPTLVEGSTNAFSSDLSGGLRITGTINASSSMRSTTADPSYVNGTDNSLSSDLAGYLRSLCKQTGTWTVGLSAGAALVGKVGIDQTTPGTTNAVAATNFPTAADVNSGNLSNSTLRACLATNSVAIPLWGHGATGAAVPANATYVGMNVSGNLTGLVGTANGLKVDGSAVTQPVSMATAPALVAGTAFIGYVGHGKTIKTATVNITSDTDIVAAVSTKRIKVIAYGLFKVGTNANPILFKSNGTGGTELARVLLQSQASAVFGAVDSIAAPSFLFATVAGEKLTIDVGDGDTITGYITYFDDDAT